MTAVIMNLHVRDEFKYLHGDSGDIVVAPSSRFSIVPSSALGAELGFTDMTVSAPTPNKYIRARSGVMEWVNSAYSAVIATLTDAGAFKAKGTVFSNLGAAGEMRMDSNNALYFDSGASNYIYESASGVLQTGGRFLSGGMDSVRTPYGVNSHINAQFIFLASQPSSASGTWTSAYGSTAYGVLGAAQQPVNFTAVSLTGFTIGNGFGAGAANHWVLGWGY